MINYYKVRSSRNIVITELIILLFIITMSILITLESAVNLVLADEKQLGYFNDLFQLYS